MGCISFIHRKQSWLDELLDSDWQILGQNDLHIDCTREIREEWLKNNMRNILLMIIQIMGEYIIQHEWIILITTQVVESTNLDFHLNIGMHPCMLYILSK